MKCELRCATSFTGCGKKNSLGVAFDEATKVDKNCVYKQEDFAEILSEGDKVDALRRAGDKITAICQTAEGKFKYTSFNTNGSDAKSCDIGGKKDDFITICDFDNEGNAYMVFMESKGKTDYTPFLAKVDPAGKMVSKLDVSKEFEKDYFLRCLEWTDQYGLLCGTPEGVQTYDEQSGFKKLLGKDVLGKIDGINTILELADNKLFVNYFNNSSDDYLSVIVDVEKKKIVKKLKAFKDEHYYFFMDENGTLFAVDSEGIYKCDLEADKLQKMLDYKDSSISSDNVMSQIGMVALSEKEIIADTSVGEAADNSFVKLTKVNPEDVADKTVITLSTMGLESDIENLIMEFNRTSDKYVIKIIDYGQLCNGDYEQMKTQFNMDLTSGKEADIICFSGDESSIRNYVNKGILLDLTSTFDKGGALGDIEILPNIADMMKYDGKIYTLMPSFDLETYVVKSEYADGKMFLNYKDCDDLIKSKGMDYKTAFGSYSDRTAVCSYFWTYYGDEFVDLKNKKCNFNTPEFIEFLNFANKFPEEKNESDYVIENDVESSYAKGNGIFYPADFRNIWEYAKLKQVVFDGDIEFVGCPNNLGRNMSTIKAPAFAISSKTEHKDVIYDLIRDFLTSDKQSLRGFSTVRSKFEEELQETTKDVSDNNTDAEAMDPVTGDVIKLKPLSQEDIKKFYDYAVSVTTFSDLNTQISNIIYEEASAFFKGQKTAEEVAGNIQNRVKVYIEEKS